jgi:hypothetical protein
MRNFFLGHRSNYDKKVGAGLVYVVIKICSRSIWHKSIDATEILPQKTLQTIFCLKQNQNEHRVPIKHKKQLPTNPHVTPREILPTSRGTETNYSIWLGHFAPMIKGIYGPWRGQLYPFLQRA